MEEYDLTIIGGGPVGIFATFYAGLRDVKVQLIESLAELGGQVKALYPEKNILDVAGYMNVKGKDLVVDLEQQLGQFKPEVKLDTKVTDVVADETGFVITTNQGVTHTKAVIVATGKGKFEPRKLPLDDIEASINQHIHYFLGDLSQFAGKRVLVAGGGDSAVDTALLLTENAAEVRLMHRRDQFRALEHSVQQMEISAIIKDTPYMINKIDKLADGTLNVSLKKMKTDEIKAVNVDEIVVSYGFISENKIIQGWQIQPELSVKQNMLVNSEMMTSISGVYAIGDANDYAGKADLIATGFGEAPVAVNAAISQIYPERGGALHSSSLSIENGEVKH